MDQGDQYQFDFTRSDKFYSLSIPSYKLIGDVVLYEVVLQDLIKNKQYKRYFRFKELRQIHQSLKQLHLELPDFPKTHLFQKTNKKPELINQRRKKLEYYFKIVVNDRFTRGYHTIKKLIRQIKEEKISLTRTNSQKILKYFEQERITRSHSNLSESQKQNYPVSIILKRK